MRRTACISAVGLWAAAWACASDEIHNVGRLGSSATVQGGGTSTGGSAGAGNGAATEGGAAGAGTSCLAERGTGGLNVPGRERCYGVPYTESGGEGGMCAGRNYSVEAVPVDLYIMMDRTSSMNELLRNSTLTRWEAVSAAVQQLIVMEELQSVNVGFQFFSVEAALNDAVDCDPASYASPEVEIGRLSETGPAIAQAIADMTPWVGGSTPTYPALKGALQHAADYAASVQGRHVAVVLVTDGMPTQCAEQSVTAIAELACRGLRDAGVLTFVIGLSAGLWNLDEIARAGGTYEAYIIDHGEGVEHLVDTVRSISVAPFPCEFEIPNVDDPTLQVDYDLVQVLYWPENAGEPEQIPRIENAAVCALSPNGGWYYDDPQEPTSIHVCDCICNRFGRGIAEVRFGCKPVLFDIP